MGNAGIVWKVKVERLRPLNWIVIAVTRISTQLESAVVPQRRQWDFILICTGNEELPIFDKSPDKSIEGSKRDYDTSSMDGPEYSAIAYHLVAYSSIKKISRVEESYRCEPAAHS